MSGFIGFGSSHAGMTGQVRPGEFAPWKTKAEITGEVFVSEKGYGKGHKRRGKAKPEITHPGWKGLGAMNIYHRVATQKIDDTAELKQKLDTIVAGGLAGVRERASTSPTGKGKIGYYSNLKGA